VVKSGAMRALILLHRWLGVSLSLLFAMWFSTGIVMHSVPFPALTEADRIDGLAPIDSSEVPSRRAYRWFYSALHTMDLPALSARPTLRSALIIILCGLGVVFSLTGVVIGWRRLRLQFSL
jgi:hypothetical protein